MRRVKLDHFCRDPGEHLTYLSCHHLVPNCYITDPCIFGEFQAKRKPWEKYDETTSVCVDLWLLHCYAKNRSFLDFTRQAVELQTRAMPKKTSNCTQSIGVVSTVKSIFSLGMYSFTCTPPPYFSSSDLYENQRLFIK